MLREYLQATTVHGLRYLSEGTNWLVKLAWLICIVTSSSIAGYIIYHNVAQWEGSPTMLTKSMPAPIEVRLFHNNCLNKITIDTITIPMQDVRIPMPTITICPKQLDVRSFITNYFNKYPTPELDELMSEFSIKNHLLRRVKEMNDIYQRSYTYNPLMGCNGNSTGNHTSRCDFIRLFTAMVDAEEAGLCGEVQKRSSLGYDLKLQYGFEAVLSYVVEESKKESKKTVGDLSLSDLANTFEKVCGKSLGKGYLDGELVLSRYAAGNYSLIFLYSVLFPLTETVNGSVVVPLENPLMTPADLPLSPANWINKDLSGLGDLVGNMIMDYGNDNGYFVRYLGQLRLTNNNLLDRVFDVLFSDISRRLEIDGIAKKRHEVIDALSLFAEGGRFLFERPYKVKVVNPFVQNCTELADETGCEKPPENCRTYCSLVEKMSAKEKLIAEMYEMMVEDVNEFEEKRPKSLLPNCNWKKPCWKKIITDRQVCFTNNLEGK